MHPVCQTHRDSRHLGDVPPRCLPKECSPPALPGPMPATEVLTEGKHLKTEWLPGRRKRRQGWNGMGWGMATGRAQKILKLGDSQAWLVPEGGWAPAWWAGGSRCNMGFCRWGQHFPSLSHRISGSAQGSDLEEFAVTFVNLVPL